MGLDSNKPCKNLVTRGLWPNECRGRKTTVERTLLAVLIVLLEHPSLYSV